MQLQNPIPRNEFQFEFQLHLHLNLNSKMNLDSFHYKYTPPLPSKHHTSHTPKTIRLNMSSSSKWKPVIPEAQRWSEAQENAARTYQDFHFYDKKMDKESVLFMLLTLMRLKELAMWCYPHNQEQALIIVQTKLGERGAHFSMKVLKKNVEKLYTRFFCYGRILAWDKESGIRGRISFDGGRNRCDHHVWADIMKYDCHAKWYYVVDEPQWPELQVVFKKCTCVNPVKDATPDPTPELKDIPMVGE